MNFVVGLRVRHTILLLKNEKGKDDNKREQSSYGLGTVTKIQVRSIFPNLITVKFDDGGTHCFLSDTESLTEMK